MFDRRGLLLILAVLLSSGFMATALFGYFVSKQTIRDAIIGQDLPLTSSNIYSEIQKDLVQPILISSTMATDTFVRHWILDGERTPADMSRYLREVRDRYGAFSSFFVSDRSRNYYTGDGILKRVSPSEPRDAWYYRVRDLAEPYEINVDPDLANKDALTIFINYRVFDFEGQYLGATGIGLTVNAVRHLVDDYQSRFERTIYFVNEHGRVVLFGNNANLDPDLRQAEGLGPLLDTALSQRTGSYQYQARGDNHILHVNYIPELKWYLFVEQNEDRALKEIRETLYANLAISVVITLIVLALTHWVLNRYQLRLEAMATTDHLTGLLNRHAFGILMDKLLAQHRRHPKPISVLMADIDHFKAINDSYGHRVGDVVLKGAARILKDGLRESDLAIRWGGEEILLILQGCDLTEAVRIADKLRLAVAGAAFQSRGYPINVTLSFGAAQYNDSENPEQTISRADAALYQAKHSGRNRVCQA